MDLMKNQPFEKLLVVVVMMGVVVVVVVVGGTIIKINDRYSRLIQQFFFKVIHLQESFSKTDFVFIYCSSMIM